MNKYDVSQYWALHLGPDIIIMGSRNVLKLYEARTHQNSSKQWASWAKKKKELEWLLDIHGEIESFPLAYYSQVPQMELGKPTWQEQSQYHILEEKLHLGQSNWKAENTLHGRTKDLGWQLDLQRVKTERK